MLQLAGFGLGITLLLLLAVVRVDIIDTCMTPYAYRTSHAAVEPLVMTLLGTNRDTGFDIRLLARINEILEKEIMPKYRHLLDDTKVSIIDINVLLHQTPGGMLSNLVNQLREMDALDKIDQVYAEYAEDGADFDALARGLAAIDGLAFYNGGTVAGASQPHKHLQLVPVPLGVGPGHHSRVVCEKDHRQVEGRRQTGACFVGLRQRERQVAHLVEEQCSAMRPFKPAGPRLVGTGIGTFLMPK